MEFLKIVVVGLVVVGLGSCKKVDMYSYKMNVDGVYRMDSELSLENIVEGVIRVNHKYPWEANSLIIEMKNSTVVLVDTPYTYEATQKVVEWIVSHVGESNTIIAINTGFHFDNLGGNKYLLEQGIKIYGTTLTVQLMDEKGEDSRNQFLEWLNTPNQKKYHDVYAKAEYAKPTEVFHLDNDEEKTLSFESESLVIYYPGQTHAPDNTVVYFPNKNILFGGCMVKKLTAKDLGNTADANLTEWKHSIIRLQSKYKNASIDYVVPGHGLVDDMQLLDRTLALLGD